MHAKSTRGFRRKGSIETQRPLTHPHAVKWDDLYTVLAVARGGGLAEAARTLGVAHSTVYRRIAAFESEHGVRIFDRQGGGYALTDAGRELVSVAEQMEALALEAERRIAGRDEALRGEVRVAAPEALGESVCALLPEFQASYPDIVVQLTASADVVDLSKHEADIAIRAMLRPPESLVGRKIADVAFAAYGRRGVSDDAWVIFDESLAHTPQGKWEAKHVPAEKVRARLGSRALFVAALSAGVGVGVLPCALGDQEPGLARVGDVLPELSLPLWLLTHPDLKAVPRVRALMDYLTQRFAEQRELLEATSG